MEEVNGKMSSPITSMMWTTCVIVYNPFEIVIFLKLKLRGIKSLMILIEKHDFSMEGL